MPDSRTVLIIDDTEANRYTFGRILKTAGYTIIEAASREEGLQLATSRPLSLIILDVQLPDGNGFDVCEEIKRHPTTVNVPVLMISASFRESGNKIQGLESGADSYLTTPVDPLELLATVKALLRVRKAEERLVKSEEIFRTLANSIPALVWMSDTDKRCYYFNKAWLDFTGRTLMEELGDGWAEGMHPEDKAGFEETYSAFFDRREPFEMSYRLRRHDGEYRWILDRGEPHFNLDNSFAGFTSACIDIHDTLLAERRLKESEERFDLAMQGMNDGLWDYNLLTQEIYYSPRVKTMLGYEEHEYANTVQASLDKIHPDDLEEAWKKLNETIAGKFLDYKNLFRMQHKDGAYRWVLSRGILIRDAEGRAVRLVGAHTDVTEHKELEQQLREAYEKAEAANNAKTEFLANMSHEIRTPMNAIIGLANILSISKLTDQQKEFVSTLQVSANSLLELINDMLDIAKIEDNMIELEETDFSLHEVIASILNMMALKAKEKGLKLDLDYADNLPHAFTGDPLRIRQIIVNLVNNALKFTSQGKVEIAVSMQPATREDTENVRIAVQDTGIGIPAEKADAIFEKFTQVDSSVTRKYGGSGLGLTISKSLVEKMNGAIHLHSVPGEGSIFTIELPLKKTALQHPTPFAQKIAPDVGQAANDGIQRVLLVEDHAPNVLVATILLEEFGYAYEVVSNGNDALDTIKKRECAVVLMDVQMQGQDGIEVTRKVREYEKANNLSPVPIIAMTAHALTGYRDKCLQAGMNDYISKPFDPAELQDKIATYMPKKER